MRPLALAFLGTAILGLPAAETLTIAGDFYPPYTMDAASAQPGAMVELAKAILEPAGYRIDYRVMPWTRVLKDVQDGKLNAAVAADHDSSPELAFPDCSQGHYRLAYLTRKDDPWTYAGTDSLRATVVGYAADYTYGKDSQGGDLDAAFKALPPDKGHVIKGDKPLETGVAMLSRKRISVIFDGEEVLVATLRGLKLDPAGFRLVGDVGPGYPMYIAFTPNDQGRRLAALVAKGTAELRASGGLKAILDRYGMKDWER